MTASVQMLCRKVWREREAGTLPRHEMVLTRRLYQAVADDLRQSKNAGYDPETDRRVEWLRAVIKEVREHGGRLARPQADAVLEALVEWMIFGDKVLEMCGRDFQAGERGRE